MAANRKRVNLALQGGGAHGAFTWGVLDALLEDGRLEIEAISGASAGAMNAVAIAEGVMVGDYDGARAALRTFWTGVADATRAGAWGASPIPTFFSFWRGPAAMETLFFDLFSRVASPYDFNPFNWNPLRDLLAQLVNFDVVRSCDKLQVYVSATNVETGRTRIFKRHELTADHVMASACLPFLFQAVEIDGAPYWDGGFVGNPPLFPFFYESQSRDIVVVQINPIERRGTPRTAREIMDRMREITFNSSLLREYRNIHFVRRLLEEERLDSTRYKDILLHRVDGGGHLSDLESSSRLTVSHDFFEDLFRRGRAAGEAWLVAHYSDVGERATLDLDAVLHNSEAGV